MPFFEICHIRKTDLQICTSILFPSPQWLLRHCKTYYMGDSAEFWFLYRPVAVGKSLVPCSHSEAPDCHHRHDGCTYNNAPLQMDPQKNHPCSLQRVEAYNFYSLFLHQCLFLLNECNDQRFLITICSLISSLSLTSQAYIYR